MEKDKLYISAKELLCAYRIITKVMKNEGYTQDTSFKRVQTWFSTAICDRMSDEEILDT